MVKSTIPTACIELDIKPYGVCVFQGDNSDNSVLYIETLCMFLKAIQVKMLSKQFSVVAMLISTLAFMGCDAMRRGIPGSGTAKSESRTIAEFDQIEIEGIGTINVTFGETPSVRLSFDDNLLEYVTTDVENGVLKVSLRESISSNNSLMIDVVTPKLTQVKIEGVAKVFVHEAKFESLKLRSSVRANLWLTVWLEA